MVIRTKADEEYQRRSDAYAENEFKCKNCGHKVVVTKNAGKNLCSCCNNYVFRDSKEEFKYRMNEINRRIYGK